MPSPFDPYRDALVVEEQTLWAEDARVLVADWPSAERDRLARELHRDAATAASLDYVRVHTGFCRQVTVLVADVERLRSNATPTDDA